jgi:hypothetical protein
MPGRLAKLLFPNTPRHVRTQRMQALRFAAFLAVLAGAVVAMLLWLLNR